MQCAWCGNDLERLPDPDDWPPERDSCLPFYLQLSSWFTGDDVEDAFYCSITCIANDVAGLQDERPFVGTNT